MIPGLSGSGGGGGGGGVLIRFSAKKQNLILRLQL